MRPIFKVVNNFVKTLRAEKKKNIEKNKKPETQLSSSSKTTFVNKQALRQDATAISASSDLGEKPFPTSVYIDNEGHTVIRINIPENNFEKICENIKRSGGITTEIKKISILNSLEGRIRRQYDDSNKTFWDILISTQENEKQKAILELLNNKKELLTLNTHFINQISPLPKLNWEKKDAASMQAALAQATQKKPSPISPPKQQPKSATKTAPQTPTQKKPTAPSQPVQQKIEPQATAKPAAPPQPVQQKTEPQATTKPITPPQPVQQKIEPQATAKPASPPQPVQQKTEPQATTQPAVSPEPIQQKTETQPTAQTQPPQPTIVPKTATKPVSPPDTSKPSVPVAPAESVTTSTTLAQPTDLELKAARAAQEKIEKEDLLRKKYMAYAEKIKSIFPEGSISVTIKDKEDEVQLSFGKNATLYNVVRRNLEDYQKPGKIDIGNNFTLSKSIKLAEMLNDDRLEMWREAFKNATTPAKKSTELQDSKKPTVITKRHPHSTKIPEAVSATTSSTSKPDLGNELHLKSKTPDSAKTAAPLEKKDAKE